MIKDLRKFQMDLKRFGEVVTPKNHTRLCVRLAVILHQKIVTGTGPEYADHPVDTGWARANWGVVIGRVCPTKPVGERPAEGSAPLPTNTYFQPKAILKATPIYPFIWVYNNVPYINVLENGHSTKAPTGMVVNALNSLQTHINNLPDNP